ncbi:molybdate ABC transporter substrate-binding protein [uncultured Mitsuokella sp.]|uniref:molybdate ABC transporter substrate-binding protein n=1 Tax=uncultured Mitsuokella sp. TaxID=453120 RepID=UPI002626094C|nr:molybdate ABC transporter substrate-binding protein [uncultured Mitsuokella sp.]
MKKFLVLCVSALMLLMAGCGGEQASAPASGKAPAKDAQPVELHVAAAASLTDVMKELADTYEKDHPGVKLVFNFGSSGALQQAIENGGETDLFYSAAQKQMNALQDSGNLVEGTRKDLLENEVVLVVPKEGGKDIKSFEDLTHSDIQHVALGEPKGVPVGQYTEEILKKLGILDQVKAKAVYGSDVRQVLSWTETGDADCGVVYATDAAVSDKVKVAAKAPAGSHKPVIYPAAVIKGTKHPDEAKDFLAFTSSDAAKKIFEKYGFTCE